MRQALVNYFTWRGRLSRRQYWGWYQVPLLVLTLGAAWVTMAQYPNVWSVFTSDGQIDPAALDAITRPVATPRLSALSTALTIVQVPIYIALLFATMRRFHDRGKSGWWTTIALVPFIGPLWLLVEVGCLRGTIGPNRFGPDPVQ